MKQAAIILSIFSIVLSSCVDENLTNIQENTLINPEYSVPVGKTEIVLEELVEEYDSDLVEIIDTLNIPDSVLTFLYNQVSYYSPLVFEYSTFHDYDFSSVTEEMDYIKNLMFRINVHNGVPAELWIQVYFLNEDNIEVDSLFNNGWFVLDAATTDDSGQVTQAAEQFKQDINFSEEEINMLKLVRRIRVDAELHLEKLSGKKIRYFSEQTFWLQMGLRVELEVPLDEANI